MTLLSVYHARLLDPTTRRSVYFYNIEMGIFTPKRLDLTRGGLAKVFGTLEAKIVEYVWAEGTVTAREVCDALSREQEISFNAVNTVINRLVEKELLSRRRVDGCWQYQARVSREELCRKVSESVLLPLMKDKKLFSAAAFLSVFDQLSPAERSHLRKLLK